MGKSWPRVDVLLHTPNEYVSGRPLISAVSSGVTARVSSSQTYSSNCCGGLVLEIIGEVPDQRFLFRRNRPQRPARTCAPHLPSRSPTPPPRSMERSGRPRCPRCATHFLKRA